MIGAGLIIGIIAAVLVLLGNPKNMGFCIACFIRDTAGAVGLHQAAAVQYIRPEIIGLVLGAFVIAAVKKEFLPRGGSSPMTRFVLGFFVMITALVFLGCPFRMINNFKRFALRRFKQFLALRRQLARGAFAQIRKQAQKVRAALAHPVDAVALAVKAVEQRAVGVKITADKRMPILVDIDIGKIRRLAGGVNEHHRMNFIAVEPVGEL